MQGGKTITIRGDEARAYDALREWAGRNDAARFVLAVLNSRPLSPNDHNPQKWFVSSSSPGYSHVVDIELPRVSLCAVALSP